MTSGGDVSAQSIRRMTLPAIYGLESHEKLSGGGGRRRGIPVAFLRALPLLARGAQRKRSVYVIKWWSCFLKPGAYLFSPRHVP